MGVRALLPWYVRIGAKIVLSRVPASYRAWQRWRIFSHGEMARAEYAEGVFRQHFDAASFARKAGGFVALELGPGDGLLSAVIAAAHGAARCYLIDTGAYAVTDLAPYRQAAERLRARGLPAPDLAGAQTLAEVLRRCNAVYLTAGLASLRELPAHTVDFVWSHAVLEHIRLRDFPGTLRELHRVLVPGGCASHQVDLQDHLGGSLNNLRFTTRRWEADWFARSGFYTNRIRFREMLAQFAAAGFYVADVHASHFGALPLPRAALAPEFRNLPDEELLVSGFRVVLRPASADAAAGVGT